MKTVILFAFLLLSQTAFAQYNLPVTFNDTEVAYVVTDFGDNESQIVTDPTNPENTVVRTTKPDNAELWAGTTIGTAPSFFDPLPFSPTFATMTVRVWSPDAGIPVRLKVETAGDPTRSVETEALTTVAGEWEILTFDFRNEATGTAAINYSYVYNVASIFFNFGTTGTIAGEKTYYWDDVSLGEADEPVSGGITFPVDFEDEEVDWENAFTNFDGGNLTRIANPDQSGINNSANVARMIKGAGQPWGGSYFAMAGNIDLDAGTDFTVKVWSPRADAQMLFKIENETEGSQAWEIQQEIGVAEEWTELTFDMSGANPAFEYKKIVVIFDLGTIGDGSADFTWYLDDIVQTDGGGTGEPGTVGIYTLPVTFDDPEVDYVVTDFGGNASTIVADPTNAENTVVQTTKTDSAELWAGTTVGEAATFTEPLPFTPEMAMMNVRVWSPDAGIPVRLKVEDADDPTRSVETEATTTVAGEWETLQFNFLNEAGGTAAINYDYIYNKASIFFNFGTTGAVAGEKTYYWDDVALGGVDEPVSVAISLPVDFENEDVDWENAFTNFDGGNLTRIANPDQSGMNSSANVARMVKGAGQPWGGSFFTLDEVIDMELGTAFSVKVWSPRADARMLFKIENETVGSQAYELDQTIGVANEWTELVFDMSPANMDYEYKKVVVIFDLGVVGDGTENFTFYFDDITQQAGSGLTGPPYTLPVTFDQEDVNYVVTDFGGNASEIVTDPTNPENTVVQTTKTVSAELWAGTTIGQNASFTERLPFTQQSAKMSVRVWSPDAGIQVRLKVENANDPTISVETEATTTLAGEWEVLEFDFQNEATGTAAINYGYTYNKASIFFNFGVTGADAGEKTYYWDDVTLIDGETGEGLIVFPVTFENEEVDWNSTFINFDGGNLSRIANPDKSGINLSDHVARMIKGAGQVWGGAYFSMDNVIDMDLSTEFTVKVWSPRADAQMLFKIENQTNGAQAWEIQQPVGVAGEWTELTFDMSGANMAWQYQKVVIIFDLGTVGDGSANFTFYIDDIDQKTGTSIEGPATELPAQVALGQNYPNPFNPTTQIAFDLPESSEIRLDVFNVMGQRVATLVDGSMPAGSHQVTFNAAHLANGVYLYRLQTGTQSFTRKMTLLK
jgi:hypothetical protein